MKKLITLFSFLAFISLIFIGCQSTENITAPEDLSKAPPASFTWGDPTAGTLPYTVDLVAGQKNVVGTVTVEKVDGCGLKVTYKLSAAGKIDEVHVDLALAPASFTVNSQKSPTFGNFDSKTFGATIEGIGSDEVSVTFDCDQLKKALGTDNIAPDTKIYIAAHSGVCMETGETTEATAELCPDLSGAQGAMVLQGLGNAFVNQGDPPVPTLQPGSTHYMNNLRFTKTVVEGVDVFKGWCLDPERGVDFPSDQPQYYERPLKFVCSTDETISTCVIFHPENLWKVNWIINNRGSYSIGAIQVAIWKLLSDGGGYSTFMHSFDTEAEALIAEIPESWTPKCGDKVLVVVYEDKSTNPCEVELQPIGIEVEVECMPVYKCDTAMGFNYPTNDGTSALFNHQWFRYFAFTY